MIRAIKFDFFILIINFKYSECGKRFMALFFAECKV